MGKRKYIHTYKSYKSIKENIDAGNFNATKFDILSTLTTMIEGDDVYFEPLDPEDEIFKIIGYDFDYDIEEWVDSLTDEKAENIHTLLTEKGYL